MLTTASKGPEGWKATELRLVKDAEPKASFKGHKGSSLFQIAMVTHGVAHISCSGCSSELWFKKGLQASHFHPSFFWQCALSVMQMFSRGNMFYLCKMVSHKLLTWLNEAVQWRCSRLHHMHSIQRCRKIMTFYTWCLFALKKKEKKKKADMVTMNKFHFNLAKE